MNIIIPTSGLFDKIKTISAFIAKISYNTDGVDLFETILITDQEKPFFEKSYSESTSLLAFLFGDFLVKYNSEEIELLIPTLPTQLIPVLISTTQDFIENMAISSWLTNCRSDMNAEYKTKANTQSALISQLIYTKKKPIK